MKVLSERFDISKEKLSKIDNKYNQEDNNYKLLEIEYYSIIVSMICFICNNKNIFRKNSDLAAFYEAVFKFEIKEYALKNRNLILAHTIREVSKVENRPNYEKYANRLNMVINRMLKDDNKLTYIDYIREL